MSHVAPGINPLQPSVHPLAKTPESAPLDAWPYNYLPEGYQAFRNLLKDIVTGWEGKGEWKLQWKPADWESHWLKIITPTLWNYSLQKLGKNSMDLVTYVLKKNTNRSWLLKNERGRDDDPTAEEEEAKVRAGHLTFDLFHRNFPSIEQLFETDFQLPPGYEKSKYRAVSWLRMWTQRKLRHETTTFEKTTLPNHPQLANGYSVRKLKSVTDQAFTKLREASDLWPYGIWIRDSIKAEVGKAEREEKCGQLFRVIAALMACRKIVNLGGTLNIEVLIKGYLPDANEFTALCRVHPPRQANNPSRPIPSSIEHLPRPSPSQQYPPAPSPPRYYDSPSSALPCGSPALSAYEMPPPRRPGGDGDESTISNSSTGSLLRRLDSFSSVVSSDGSPSGLPRRGPLRRTSTMSSSDYPYPQSPSSPGSPWSPGGRGRMRPPPSVTQQPVVVTRQPVQRSQPGIASSVQARSPPIPTPEDRHRATAELKEHYHEKLGVVDEHVALLCAIAGARNLTPQNSIIVYAYLRRLNAAGKRSDGSNVFELPFSLELPQTLGQIATCVAENRLEWRRMELPAFDS